MGRQLKYDQAKLAVLSLIASEKLQPGDKIMTEQQLLSHVPCSRITLRKALESLEHDGMIERHVGRGTFLKQCVANKNKSGKILFINVNRPGELSYPPPRAREYMQFYFDERNLEFQYLQVNSFSNEIVREAKGVLGILLYGWLSDDFMKSIASLKIPMIIVGNSRRFPGIPQVELDVKACAGLVTEELIRGGARRIVLFNAPKDYYLACDIETGFRETMKKHGLEISPKTLITMPDDGQDLLLDRLIPEYENYDALIFELGIYYGFLSANRINHWNLRKKIAVLPLGSDLVEHWNRYVVRASADAFFGRFYQSTFETASEMLLEHILKNTEMKSIKIKPEIDNGTRRTV